MEKEKRRKKKKKNSIEEMFGTKQNVEKQKERF